MPKVEFTTNQLGLVLKVVREAMPKAKKSMTYSLVSGLTDYRGLCEIEDKVIDTAFRNTKGHAKRLGSV